MANITKTQIRKRIEKLIEQLNDLQLEVQELKDEVENEANDIEPYGDRDELTEAQEERQQWLEDAVGQLDEADSNIESALDSLMYID